MGFLIDTDLWIAVERGKLSAADLHAITKAEPVFVSPINLAEMQFGAELIDDPQLKQRAISMIRKMKRKALMRITGDTAEVFGVLAAKLTRSGRQSDFRIQDLWLAAQAVQRDFTLLTGNGKHFRDVPDLKFIEVPH
ncbi:MAG: PilT protein domain protein [Verrucomicrobiales bacterium]|nr:PilT protein domain protein [Verrucomicrobiales bacterium]